MVRRVIKKLLRPIAAPIYSRLRNLMRESVDQLLQEKAAQTREASQVQADALRAFSASTNDRLTCLQLGVDAARQEIQLLKTLSGAANATALGAISTGLAEIEQTIGSLANLTGLTLSRADVLVQRVAIPVSGSELLMRSEDGFLMVPAEDRRLVAAMSEGAGRLEPGTLRVLQSLVSEGDCVVDVGAHIGLLTVPIAQRVGKSGSVIAVEPALRSAGLLRQSLAINGVADRVTVYQCALGDQAGSAFLNLGIPLGHSSLLPLPDAVGTQEVKVVTLDELIEPGRAIKCVKIDAEGLEPQIWRGMTRVIAENPDLAVIVEFGPEHLFRANISIDDWVGTFVKSGFAPYEIDELTGNLSPLRGVPELRLVTSVNLFLARNSSKVFSLLNVH